MTDIPWYTGSGILFGVVIAVGALALLWGDIIENDNPPRVWHLGAIIPLLAWWWLPWVLYALSFIPTPAMPPVLPTQVEKP